jgi:hypothetical protein
MRKKEFTGLYNMDAERMKSMNLDELKSLGALLPEMPEDVKAMYSDALEAYENALKQKEQYASGNVMEQNASMMKQYMDMNEKAMKDNPAYAAIMKQYTGAAPSAADEIKKLAGLKDQGIITQEEFAAKKKQLLGL